MLKSSSLLKHEISSVHLHGTGTALGDPIEIGALAAVFGNSNGNCTNIYSIKSMLGHAEGNAGCQTMLGTLESLSNHLSLPCFGLRNLNPHVVDSFNDWKGRRLIPREYSCRPEIESGSCSAFGMSGTNAHGVFTSLQIETDKGEGGKIIWERRPFWPSSLYSNRLDISCTDTSLKQATFHSMLTSKASYLMDHVVQGNLILPGAAMLDLSYTCIRSVNLDGNPGVGEAIINIPVQMSNEKVLVLECNVQRSEGRIDLVSQKQKVKHFSAMAFRMQDHQYQKSLNVDLPGLKTFYSIGSTIDVPSTGAIAPRRDQTPAIVDCSIQLGPAGNQDQQDAGRQTRVVASIRMYLPANGKLQKQFTCAFRRISASNIIVNHHSMNINGHNTSFRISDLVAKPINIQQGRMKAFEQVFNYASHWKSFEPLERNWGIRDIPLQGNTQRSNPGSLVSILGGPQLSLHLYSGSRNGDSISSDISFSYIQCFKIISGFKLDGQILANQSASFDSPVNGSAQLLTRWEPGHHSISSLTRVVAKETQGLSVVNRLQDVISPHLVGQRSIDDNECKDVGNTVMVSRLLYTDKSDPVETLKWGTHWMAASLQLSLEAWELLDLLP